MLNQLVQSLTEHDLHRLVAGGRGEPLDVYDQQ